MTLTQVSTWFANARRRLKKENSLKDEEDDRTESSIGKNTLFTVKTNFLDESEVAVYSSPSVLHERKNGETKKPEAKIWRIVDEI